MTHMSTTARYALLATMLLSLPAEAANPTGATKLEVGHPEYGLNISAAEVLEGRVFFTLNDMERGTELWVSDGTNEGTHIVRDMNEGEGHGAHDLSSLGKHIIFTATTPAEGKRELWRTDGTEAGVELLADIQLGEASGNARSLVRAGCLVFFTADDGEHGQEFWATDGTPGGTRMVKDIAPADVSHGVADYIVAAGDVIFFRANDGTHGDELWTSDGTAEGTYQVKDITPGSDGSRPIPFAGHDGEALFAAQNYVWVTDGTEAGTVKLAELHEENGFIGIAKPFKGGWAFVASDDEHGTELWFSDGTPEGTEIMFDANPGPGSGFGVRTHGNAITNDSMHPLGVFDGRLYFQVFESGDGIGGFSDLASSDGSSFVIHAPDMMGASRFVATKQHLFFAAAPPAYGAELFTTDGTIGNAVIVENITNGGSTTIFKAGPIPAGDKALFVAKNTIGMPDSLFSVDLPSTCNCTPYETCEDGRCVAPETCMGGTEGSGDGPGGEPGDPNPGCSGTDCPDPTSGDTEGGSSGGETDGGGAASDDAGCGCNASASSGHAAFILMLLGFARRRSRGSHLFHSCR